MQTSRNHIHTGDRPPTNSIGTDRSHSVLNIPCAVKSKIHKENVLHIPFIAFLPLFTFFTDHRGVTIL